MRDEALWNLRAVPQPLQIVPASLLLLARRQGLAGLCFDPLSHLTRVPHPSVRWGLLEGLGKLLPLLGAEQRSVPGARVVVPVVAQGLGSIGVITTSELLDPAPGVSGDFHHLASSLALANEPNDLVVAARDWIAGLALTVLQLFLA